jgi:hypothetical protein
MLKSEEAAKKNNMLSECVDLFIKKSRKQGVLNITIEKFCVRKERNRRKGA